MTRTAARSLPREARAPHWAIAALLAVAAAGSCRSKPLDVEQSAGGAAGADGGVEGRGGSGEAGAPGVHPASGQAGQASGAGPGAGEAGAGGPSGVPDGAPPEPTGVPWLDDASAWERVDTLPQCWTRIARRPAELFPGFAWEQTCGPGCERAALVHGDKPVFAAMTGKASRVAPDGTLYLSISIASPDPLARVLSIHAFPGGEAVFMASESRCDTQFASVWAPRLIQMFPSSSPGQDLTHEYFVLGFVDESWNSTWKLLPPSVPVVMQEFDFETGWGVVVNSHAIHLKTDVLSTDLRLVYDSPGLVNSVTGLDGAISWIEIGENRVAAWSPEQDVVTIAAASGDWVPVRLGMNRDRYVWIEATGERITSGAYETAELRYCERRLPLEACDVQHGPALPIVGSSEPLLVQDRWAAVTVHPTEEVPNALYVFDLDAGAVYVIEPPDPDRYLEAVGLSATELIAAEHTGFANFDRLVRWDLGRIEEFADRLQ